jgi:hypothetical protein
VWSRWANMNQFPVDGILEELVFARRLSEWRELVFSWDELELIPTRWKDALSSWHGVYTSGTVQIKRAMWAPLGVQNASTAAGPIMRNQATVETSF